MRKSQYGKNILKKLGMVCQGNAAFSRGGYGIYVEKVFCRRENSTILIVDAEMFLF